MANLNVRGDALVENLTGGVAPAVPNGSPGAAGLKIAANSGLGNYLAFTDPNGTQTWGYFSVNSSGLLTWSGSFSSSFSAYLFSNIRYFITGTNATYTPTTGTRAILVEVWGGGGGGGGTQAQPGFTVLSSGGGGGGYSRVFVSNMSQTFRYNVGSGGSGGVGGTVGVNLSNGGVGGTTTFFGVEGLTNLCSSPGGRGGIGFNGLGINSNIVTETPGNTASLGTNGTINLAGGCGSSGSIASVINPSTSGSAPFIGGGLRGSLSAFSNGPNAINFGEGGGSAYTAGANGPRNGGTGAGGLLQITEYF